VGRSSSRRSRPSSPAPPYKLRLHTATCATTFSYILRCLITSDTRNTYIVHLSSLYKSRFQRHRSSPAHHFAHESNSLMLPRVRPERSTPTLLLSHVAPHANVFAIELSERALKLFRNSERLAIGSVMLSLACTSPVSAGSRSRSVREQRTKPATTKARMVSGKA
jgi:hypothetical protein